MNFRLGPTNMGACSEGGEDGARQQRSHRCEQVRSGPHPDPFVWRGIRQAGGHADTGGGHNNPDGVDRPPGEPLRDGRHRQLPHRSKRTDHQWLHRPGQFAGQSTDQYILQQ